MAIAASTRGQARMDELKPPGVPRTLSQYASALWAYRNLGTVLPVEELRAQHFNTVLGNVWHLLNPLLLVAIYFLVFGVVLDGRGGVDNFLGFLTVGVFMFHFTQKSVTSASRSLVANSGLIQSLVFPRAILPLSSVIAQALALVPSLVVMLLIAALTGVRPSLLWVLVVAVAVGQLMFNVGAALIAARLTHRFRDVEQILPYVFRLLFYGSGVLYSVDHYVGDVSWRLLFDLNPLYGFVSLSRWVVLAEPVNQLVVVNTLGWAVASLLGGTWFFIRGEREYGRG